MSETAAIPEEKVTAIKQEHELIRRVFSTPEGSQLLGVLAEQYVWSKQLHPDPHVLASRIGIQDLVTHFMYIANGGKYE